MLSRSSRRAASALARELHRQPIASTSAIPTSVSLHRDQRRLLHTGNKSKTCTRAVQCSASAKALESPRCLSSSATRKLATPVDEVPEGTDPFDLAKVERVSDQVDVCIVGGGPAGLSAAIRIMQLAKEQGKEDMRVIVLEKGGEVGKSVRGASRSRDGTDLIRHCRSPHSFRSSHRTHCAERTDTRLEGEGRTA